MSISGIFSHSNSAPQIAASNPLQQFQQLGQALQSGNLSSAQSDFASLQAAFSQPATTTGSATNGVSWGTSSSTGATTNNPVNQAFHQLASDLQSGNLSAAQKDFSTVQQDLNGQNPASPTSTSGSPRHHHGYPIMAGSGGDSSSQNSLLQDLNQLGQSLTSSNLAGAQQAYSTLQQQMQQFALGGASLSSLSPVSFDA